MTRSPFLFRPEDSAPPLWLGGQGVDYKIEAADTEGRIAIVEQPLEAGRLVPPHRHHVEDELSYVLDGEIGYRVGDEEGVARKGCYLWKPRGIPHTIWNGTEQAALVLEIITPAGFEAYYRELAELAKHPGGPHLETRAELGRRYQLEYLPEWAPELMNRHDVRLPGQ
jgi:quercetin dioxygenase-like cupin family protein